MKSEIKRQEDGTITLTVTIPQTEVTNAWEKEVEQVVAHAELPGFRKGKAPRKVVEEKMNKDKVREDVLKKLLPDAYMKAVQEHNLQPIISPQIHVDKIEGPSNSGQAGWVFHAITCESPEIKLNAYKDAIQKITAKSKIIIPGKEQEKQEPKLEDVIKALLDHITVTIPKILVDREVERLLAQLLDEIKSLGLSLEQYLASTQRTVDQLKEEYAKKAENDIKFEIALQKIAEEEKIVVEPKEIDEAIAKATDPKERENLERNRYLLTSILRQQKTLDFLKNL